jgi:hypothetical protein
VTRSGSGKFEAVFRLRIPPRIRDFLPLVRVRRMKNARCCGVRIRNIRAHAPYNKRALLANR